jgi:ATP-dependent DNA ligase I
MKYSEIVETYIKIEQTTKRLEMTDHLVELLIKTPSDLLDKILYLTQGKLYPDFLGIELGIADKLAIKAIAFGTGINEKEVNSAMLELGDLGLVAEQMVAKKKQQALFTEPLYVTHTYNNFDKIAKAAGGGSQDLKLKLVAELLHDASPVEAKYIVRTLAGKLRLGIADMTILDALAYVFTPSYPEKSGNALKLVEQNELILKAISENESVKSNLDRLKNVIESCSARTTGTLYEAISLSEKFKKSLRREPVISGSDKFPELESNAEGINSELRFLKKDVETTREKIENAYNVSSDLGEVARVLTTENLKGLEKIKLKPGVPLRAMLAERLSSLDEIFKKLKGECAFEYKYDGLRIQAHLTDDVQLFSRRLENITSQFPDVQERLKESFKGKSAVVEGECVPVDVNTGELLPFQQVSHRRGRKYELSRAMDEFPVVLFLFDLLYYDGKDFTSEPLQVRREKLTEIFNETEHIKFSHILITKDQEEAKNFFEESLANGSEGLIAKSIQPDSFYRAGSRGWQWIKYKREYKAEMTDSVDLVVIGAFAGRGRRAGVYGALLMAAYNQVKDEFETVCKVGTGFSDEVLAQIPEKLKEHLIENKHARVNAEMKADYWFNPNLVMEIVGAEITHSPIHTCARGVVAANAGMAVRFPRFVGNWRTDKKPEDATSSEEIVKMYKQQLKQIES